MIICGIDPGSQITGIGFIQSKGSQLKALAFYPLVLKKLELPDKLLTLEEKLLEGLAEYKPQALAIEKVFHGVNFKSTLLLGQVRGVLMLAAAKAQVPVYEYAPTEVKKAVVGFGRAEKTQIQAMVKQILGLDEIPKPHDVADALALAICHAHSFPMLEKGLNPFSKKF